MKMHDDVDESREPANPMIKGGGYKGFFKGSEETTTEHGHDHGNSMRNKRTDEHFEGSAKKDIKNGFDNRRSETEFSSNVGLLETRNLNKFGSNF